MRRLASFILAGAKFPMNLSNFLTALLASALVCFVSGAEASPNFQAPMFSPLPLEVGLKCGLVNGHLECGDTNSGSKHHHDDGDDDNQGNDDDHHHKNKNTDDDDTGLSECTIQQPGGGGGCKGGFKRVCEKLKSGKKCCGCVVDPNAKPGAGDPVTPTTKFECVMPGVLDYSMFAATDAEAKAKFSIRLKEDNLIPKGTVTCKQIVF